VCCQDILLIDSVHAVDTVSRDDEIAVFCMVIFLLSGLVNVALFIAICPILPAESLRIGQWYLSRATQIPPKDQERNQDQRPSQTTLHNRTGSSSSNSTFKPKQRPPDIVITRDSVDSMYTVYEEDVLAAHNAHPLPSSNTQWSPDGPPRDRYIATYPTRLC